jgi:hypothetical protein
MVERVRHIQQIFDHVLETAPELSPAFESCFRVDLDNALIGSQSPPICSKFLSDDLNKQYIQQLSGLRIKRDDGLKGFVKIGLGIALLAAGSSAAMSKRIRKTISSFSKSDASVLKDSLLWKFLTSPLSEYQDDIPQSLQDSYAFFKDPYAMAPVPMAYLGNVLARKAQTKFQSKLDAKTDSVWKSIKPSWLSF